MSTTWVDLINGPKSLANALGVGTSGQVLTSNGTTTPAWAASASGVTSVSSASSSAAFTLVTTGTTTPLVTLAYSGTAIPIANGGTGQTGATAAFNALQPMTIAGQLLYGGTAGAATALAAGSSGQILSSGGAGAPAWLTTIPIANGGTNLTALPTASAASKYAAWDANVNLDANNIAVGIQSVVGAGTTTSLAVTSPRYNIQTGTIAAHTWKLPAVTTLKLGTKYTFVNASTTQNMSVQSVGTNAFFTILPGTSISVFSISITGTDITSWSIEN